MTDATDEFQEYFCRILDLLEEHARAGLTVTAVAEKLGIPRSSASKYLQLLASSGDVNVERFGQKKFYRPLQRIPLPEIFDHLPNALVILDGDLTVRMMNAVFVATLGILPGHNIIGTRLLDLDLPIFSEPSVRQNLERIRQSQMYIADMDLFEEATDRIFRLEFSPIAMQFGWAGIMVSLRDITERLKTETELKDSKRKIATLFENVPSGILMFGADGTILNANDAALQILGLRTFEELGAASVFDFSCAPGRLESLIRKGRSDDTELACDFDRMKRDSGIPTTRSGIAFLNVIFTPIRPDSGGPPREFAILFKDITRDRRERKELTHKETRYHSFFENACNGVIIYEPIRGGEDFVFKDLNRAAEGLLGVPKAELIGRRVREAFPDLGYPDLVVSDLYSTATRIMETEKPELLPPLKYERGPGPLIWHYLFKLPTNELASFMIDVSDEFEAGNGSPTAGDADVLDRSKGCPAPIRSS